MIVLGIECSCDEAAVALVEDGHRVLAERIASQADDFAAWGGVVPEIAARGHVAAFPGIVAEVLAAAGIDRVDGIAVGAWPGLIGSLLIGVTCAKVLSARWQVPLTAVDHIAAHLAAVHLGRPEVPYPLAGLVASGGHSHLYIAEAPGHLRLVGGTIDDAAGEAFDKAAAVLGLGYPGGPAVDRLAAGGDSRRVSMPKVLLPGEGVRLSFSGLKTAFLYHAKGPKGEGAMHLDAQGQADACASFQAAACEGLAVALGRVARTHGARALAVGGGVACNRGLRARMQREADHGGWPLLLPEPKHCADNAAMIAALGYHNLVRGEVADLELAPKPTGKRAVSEKTLAGH